MPPMPEEYEDTLPMVVPMNRDYDEGRMDGELNPLPDCTPGADSLPNAWLDDELIYGGVTLPWGSNATWEMFFPAEIRVWRWDDVLDTWWLVENATTYSVAVSGRVFDLRVEGLAPSATENNFIVVSCQKTDDLGNPIGTPLEDRVKVEVVSIDLVIDNIDELDEATRAASMLINNDYDEGVVHPRSQELVTDNGKLHGLPQLVPALIRTDDFDLTPARLTIDGPNGQNGRYWIEVVGEPEYARYVRVWQKINGNLVPHTYGNALPITLDANAVDLLIEGLGKWDDEQHPIKLIAHFIPDKDYASAGVFPDVVDQVLALVGVNHWYRLCDWIGERGQYVGFAVAGSDYDTLEQLAKNITGKAEDAQILRFSNPSAEPIRAGTVIDVSQLLAELESRLRKNVVKAAKAAKAAIFGSALNFGPAGGSTEAFVNKIFGIGRPASTRPIIDCHHMIGIIMARGVIMELMPGEFDAMDLACGQFQSGETANDGIYFNRYKTHVSKDDLMDGDWAEFWNKEDYQDTHPKGREGMWAAENVIKVGDNLYYGWGAGTKTYEEWLEKLRIEYNNNLINGGTPIPEGDPLHLVRGYIYDAGFIDVAKLAMVFFGYRQTHDM
jgi:hypothetical protein